MPQRLQAKNRRVVQLNERFYTINFGHPPSRTSQLIKPRCRMNKEGVTETTAGLLNTPECVQVPKELVGKRIRLFFEVLD